MIEGFWGCLCDEQHYRSPVQSLLTLQSHGLSRDLSILCLFSIVDWSSKRWAYNSSIIIIIKYLLTKAVTQLDSSSNHVTFSSLGTVWLRIEIGKKESSQMSVWKRRSIRVLARVFKKNIFFFKFNIFLYFGSFWCADLKNNF